MIINQITQGDPATTAKQALKNRIAFACCQPHKTLKTQGDTGIWQFQVNGINFAIDNVVDRSLINKEFLLESGAKVTATNRGEFQMQNTGRYSSEG